MFLCAIALLSGCLSREVQNAVSGVSLPYGVNNTLGLLQSGSPQRRNSSAQRDYSSATTSVTNDAQQTALSSNTIALEGMNMEGMACFQNIDQAEMNKLSEQGKQVDAEIKLLCSQGKRDKAMKKALAFAKQMSSSHFMQEMKKCGDAVKHMPMMPRTVNPEDKTQRHICDG